MPTVIVSSCGTSVFTNRQPQDIIDLLKATSNSRISEVEEGKRDQLENVFLKREKELCDCSPEEAKRLSAELNGLICYYGGELSKAAGNQHIFIHTDTWAGERAANLLCKWMRSRRLPANAEKVPALNTRNLADFHLGMAYLAKWADEVLKEYRRSGWRVVFNLVGGFKSFNGFLQVLGMFFADELYSIFESENALLKIPRLPVEIEETAFRAIEKNLRLVRKMSWSSVPSESVGELPETLVTVLEGEAGLSPWGELVFSHFKEKGYRKEIYPSPSGQLKFGKNFLKSLQGLAPERIQMINERIDDLCRYFETGQALKRATFKPIKGVSGISTHELYAWSDEAARRLFLHQEGEVWVLDELGDHL